MSVVHGQENPQLPFNRTFKGFRAYMLDGSVIQQDNVSDANFKVRWNQLDHANVISINQYHNQRYGQRDADGTDKWKRYKKLIHTNDDEFTHYWMNDDTLQIAEGNAVDIPVNAHDYPKTIRDQAVTNPIELVAMNDEVWN